MKRRTFIKSTAAVGLGGLVLGTGCADGEADGESDMVDTSAETTPSAPAEGRALPRIGVQLYTLRSLMEKDFAGVVEQVAALGYDELEFAGYYDQSPADIRVLLDRVGMTAPSIHVGIDILRQDLDKVLEDAATIGHQYIVCPYLADNERSIDDYKQHAAFFNEVGEKCKAVGLQFAYHNHDFEFIETDGQIPYDLLLDETDASLVQMELDLFWVQKAGMDPVAYFGKSPGRFPLCHVKDMRADGEMSPVGEGVIDFAAIFAHTDHAGLKHYFVEHDHPDDPIQSITTSYNHLNALRF